MPIFSYLRDYDSLGGAGNVAMNLKALDIEVLAITSGNSAFIKKISSYGINTQYCLHNNTIETIVKNRYFVQHHQVFRSDYEIMAPLGKEDEERAIQQVLKALTQPIACIIISDYKKGFLSPRLIKCVLDEANKRNIKTLVDPKGKDFSIYDGAYLLKPNKDELFNANTTCFSSDLLVRGQSMYQELNVKYLLVTCSDKGMNLFDNGNVEHFTTEKSEVIDVTGAGDTVISTMAYALLLKLPINQAVILAQHAASIVIRKLGCSTVDVSLLEKKIQNFS
jgi:D-beta-D-heptose 7-phosphate kinase / D-beta-D-heptose 1-phosphate adenosyltransferase